MDFDVAEFEREAAAHLVRDSTLMLCPLRSSTSAVSLFRVFLAILQGNANGNVYYRKPGIPKENDGQGKLLVVTNTRK